MRRKEFAVTEPAEIEGILTGAQWGVLALLDEDQRPYQVPVNPIWFAESLWFHSSLAGKKMKILQNNKQVHFSVVQPLSLIPSYASDPEIACKATQFFLSVSIQGEAKIIESLEDKIKMLNAMMLRLQPQGGYKPISLDDPRYVKELKATAVVQIETKEITGKFKLGQNLTAEHLQRVMDTLEKSGSPQDLQTVEWIKKAKSWAEDN